MTADVRIWLDDVRPMPAGYNFHARTVDEVEGVLGKCAVSHISFDHDLGEDADGNVLPSGYDLAKIIERMAYVGTLEPLQWRIHSLNPVGRENIRKAMSSADRAWFARKLLGNR